MVKFGRVRYLVKEIAHPVGKESAGFSEKNLAAEPLPATEEHEPCRICRSDRNVSTNPLISACKCAGSIKYIHAECMRAWYQSKMLIRTTSVAKTYSISSELECELCKAKLPFTVAYPGGSVDLARIEKPAEGPYIVLESEQTPREVHVVSLQSNGTAIIGRNHECDLRINDNTVSRTHAFLRFIDGDYYLEDNDSKFGTLVQIAGPLTLSAYLPYCVQVGRTVLTFLVRNPREQMVKLPPETAAPAKMDETVVRNTVGTAPAPEEADIDNAIDAAHPLANVSGVVFNDGQD